MAMANTAFKTRTASYRHSTMVAGWPQRAEKPLFQAFLRPSSVKATDRHCIKVTTTIDPACGTAGFLVSSAEYIRKNYEDTMTAEQWEHFSGDAFTGFDTDRTMLRISAMNLMLHSISNPDIDYKDSVSKQNEISDRYTTCLANPPVHWMMLLVRR